MDIRHNFLFYSSNDLKRNWKIPQPVDSLFVNDRKQFEFKIAVVVRTGMQFGEGVLGFHATG